jgi:DNA uptake protein ComE-like DNA-binding protein
MVKRVSAALVLLLLCGCSPDSLQKHTANVTASAKRSGGAIFRGVFEGLTRKGPFDINDVSAKDLQALPGVTSEKAKLIVLGRPYGSTKDLVSKKILSNAEFDKVKAQIFVKKK